MRDEILQSASGVWREFGGAAASGLRIVIILVAAWVAIGDARRCISALQVRVANRLDDPEAVRRAETLGRVFQHLASVVITVVAAMRCRRRLRGGP